MRLAPHPRRILSVFEQRITSFVSRDSLMLADFVNQRESAERCRFGFLLVGKVLTSFEPNFQWHLALLSQGIRSANISFT